MSIEEYVTIPKKDYESLLQLICDLRSEIESLKCVVTNLQEEIRLLKNGKKSTTSHTSPSHDIGRSNSISLREKSGKKTGGQPGHKGTTLQMSSTPDDIIEYKSEHCALCSTAIDPNTFILQERKQEIVIPPIKARYVEHRSYSNVCTCGYTNVEVLPTHLQAPIQYGASVSAAIAYFFAYQYVPYNRIKHLMLDLYGIALSEGTISNLLSKVANCAKPMYEEIQFKLQESEVVGGDETGTKINGEKGWFHVWQNNTLTFIVAATTRGYQTTKTYFEKGFAKAVYVSDCWAAQLKTPAQQHQLCLAHLLRELTNFEEALNCTWSKDLKTLFKKAIQVKQDFKVSLNIHPPNIIEELKLELENMLAVDSKNFHKKKKAFINRLIKNQDSIFTFLDYESVPYDNNGSERAIRNVKVKNKVSGCFRSTQGATQFAILRSVIDTAIKNSIDVFATIKMMLQGVAE